MRPDAVYTDRTLEVAKRDLIVAASALLQATGARPSAIQVLELTAVGCTVQSIEIHRDTYGMGA